MQICMDERGRDIITAGVVVLRKRSALHRSRLSSAACSHGGVSEEDGGRNTISQNAHTRSCPRGRFPTELPETRDRRDPHRDPHARAHSADVLCGPEIHTRTPRYVVTHRSYKTEPQRGKVQLPTTISLSLHHLSTAVHARTSMFELVLTGAAEDAGALL